MLNSSETSVSFPALYRILADETRYRLIVLLLGHDYCVSELARMLAVSESAVSQQLKMLKEVGMLHGERRGHFMHYTIDRKILWMLSCDLQQLASMERKERTEADTGCACTKCGDGCSAEVKFFCHGAPDMEGKTALPMAPADRRKH
ncbi:MAG TPA: winged helix-turn-helix transcriptional regulator [Candidatus Avidesulfovibrio excrementigallinarum]|nr:winged helix-turn-helix transcriptional regulator [Candidatus Avidesulfovibrio excrementigallinarum]